MATTLILRNGDHVVTPDGPGVVHVKPVYSADGWRSTMPAADPDAVVVVLDEAYFYGVHHREAWSVEAAVINTGTNPYVRTYRASDLTRTPGGVPAEQADDAVRAFMESHRDARHGRTVAAKRKRERERLPKSTRRRMTPAQAERAMRANWSAYGVGPYPGTPAEQAARVAATDKAA